MKRKFFVWLALVCMIIGSTFTPVLADEIQPRATTLNIADGDVTNDNCGGNCTVTGNTVAGGGLFDHHNANKIDINGGTHVITLQNVTIDERDNWAGSADSAIDISGNATVTLILNGTNRVYGYDNHPGIWVEEGSTLIIQGDGSLEAHAGSAGRSTGAAGIGGGYNNGSFGNIVINSGTVSSYGSGGGAGIGGGYDVGSGECSGNITINGGYVKAYGDFVGDSVTSSAGAGIGAGENADYVGTITINGGVVYAESRKDDMPSIGGGGSIIGETSHGTFSTGTNGNAVIVAPNGIGANQNAAEWDGIFVSYDSDENSVAVRSNGTVVINDNNANVQVWGDPVLDYDLEISKGTTLRIVKNDRNNASATLTVNKGNTLTNNGSIVLGNSNDPSYLILLGGLDQTRGNGSMTVRNLAKVKMPLVDSLVTFNNTNNYTYNGKAHTPAVTVGFSNLWGYSYNYILNSDYTRVDANNDNAGQATITLNATQNGNLLSGSVTKNYTIAKADFNLGIDQEWSVKEGETNLRLPSERISISSSIQDDMVDLKNGTLTWYLDEDLTQEVQSDSLKDHKVGETLVLYGKYEHNDTNFINPKVHELNVEIVKFAVHDAAIFEGNNNVTEDDLVKEYSLDKIDLTAKIDLKDDGNYVDPLTTPVRWVSSDENVAKVDQNGQVTLVGVGKATITAYIPEHNTGDDLTSYARVSAQVDIEVTPRKISVDDSTLTVEERAYDGTKDVVAKAQLNAGSVINNDDVKLEVTGTLDDADAGVDKTVNVQYSLSGTQAQNYVLQPDNATAKVTISKADPSDHGLTANDGKMTIFNNRARNYYFALNNLLPDSKTYDFGDASYSVESVDNNPYFTKDDVTVVGNGNFLRVTVKAVDTDVEDVIGNITIKIDSNNYEYMTAKIEVSAENPEITVEPEEPTDPSDPADPSEPGDKPTQDPGIVVPDTGSSDSNMLIYVSLGVVALCVLIIVIASKKKQNLGK